MRYVDAVAVSIVVAGCAMPPSEQAPRSPAVSAPCAFVRVEQAGKVVASAGSGVALARASFSITYLGPGRAMGMHVSTRPDLATALARHARPEVWVPYGVGMAGQPGDIDTDDRIEIFRTEGQRNAATHVVHAQYWPMVRAKIEAAPIDMAVRMGLNTWWEPASGTAPRLYQVRRIDGVPVERTPQPVLHLVAFGEMERIVAQQIGIPMVSRARWNACELRFQP